MNSNKTYQWKNKHILIVEDDESSAVLLKEILKRTGADLSFSETGEDAVDHIKNHPETDLVLMDIHLPNKDGVTATVEIRELMEKIIVIAQSAYLLSAEQQQASLTKFDDFITKPVNQFLLLSKIDKYLS
jgi:CheY-like chemotaxis protein